MGNNFFPDVPTTIFDGKNFQSIVPGELTSTEVDWRWLKSDVPFFNPLTDKATLDILSFDELETLKFNTAIYTYLPIAILFDSSMFIFWISLGFANKLLVQLGGFDFLEWLRRYN